MKKVFSLLFTIISFSISIAGTIDKVSGPGPAMDLFDNLNLGRLGMARTAYDYAMIGFAKLSETAKIKNRGIITIIDYTLPSNKKRFFVIDVKNQKLLFATYVAHGRNSGLDMVTSFSNEPESYKSSIGFFTTKGTYAGLHGYSLRLQGLEPGFNDHAEAREIVIHSADYVTKQVVHSQGYCGRSLGCPALPPDVYKNVISKIKNGSCLFIFGNDSHYFANSKLLREKVVVEK